jgi:hypothetical protein
LRLRNGNVRDRRDVSKNISAEQLKQRRKITPWRTPPEHLPRPTRTTFFRHNCKIVATIFVNSFAKLYFWTSDHFACRSINA